MKGHLIFGENVRTYIVCSFCIKKPVEEKICKVCESGEIENEFHFIFSCAL